MGTKAVYDEATKTFKTQEAIKAEKAEEGLYRISLPGGLANQLLACGDADGIDRVAESKIGQKVRATGVIKMYTEQAIKEFLAARNAVTTEDE